jgi:hypothetical protein
MSSQSVTIFTSHCLATDVNNVYSSASVLKSGTEFLSTELSHSESELLYDWRSTTKQIVLAPNSFILTTNNIFIRLNTCGHRHYVTSSLTTGWVSYNCCWPSRAQLFSGPSPAKLITTFYCLRFETPAIWRATSPYLYPPGTGRPSYTPRHLVPSSSPPTIRRAMVEVFVPASTRA